jgi:putative membrane protein
MSYPREMPHPGLPPYRVSWPIISCPIGKGTRLLSRSAGESIMNSSDKRLHISLWVSLAVMLVWSGWRPADRFTWVLEVSPIFLISAVLLAIYRRFYFSRLVCWLMWLHAIVLLVGGHYTYAEVPLFDWIRDAFHLSRNHYDRVGHFMQGFVPAMISREVLLRLQVVNGRGWLLFIVVSTCLAISASYELIEWAAAVFTGSKADAFLGSQGDVWDSQWDMAMALVGAMAALSILGKAHDHSMKRLSQ